MNLQPLGAALLDRFGPRSVLARRATRRAALLGLALLACLGAGAEAYAQAMQVPGSFGVGSTGAAGYSVPIQVPPGTAGMAPSLTLSYSSQGGNGIVGMGWTLGGLPSIGRCGQTIAQDGQAGTVTYTASDRFCYEGQRLVAINGAYGADGTEYRTEIDSFSRIVSHGTAGTGPAWFQVWTKSGQVMEFGNTADSRMLVLGSATARSWGANKISDPSGNYLTVAYTQKFDTGEAFPAEIDYTGNTATGLAPYNKVVFSYTSRPDGVNLYQGGAPLRTWVRLSNIRTYTSNVLVFDYQLNYQQGLSGRSRLASLTLCQSDEQTCLPPTSFSWDDGGDGTVAYSQGTQTWGSLLSPASAYYTIVTGDFYGSGKTDFMAISDTFGYLEHSNGDGTFTGTQVTWPGWYFGTPASAQYTTVTGDFYGTGRTDIMLIGSSAAYLLHSKGDGTFSQVQVDLGGWAFGGPPSGAWTVLTGDFNGDGRTDVILLGPTSYCLMTSNGDGTFTRSQANYPAGWNFGGNPSNNWSVQTGDFNGDGKTDVIFLGNTNYLLMTSNGDGTFTPFSASYGGWGFGSPPANNFTVLTGDFNGDGLTDILFLGNTGYELMTSKGDGTFANSQASYGGWGFGTPPTANYAFETGDFFGDGRTGVMFIGNTTGGIMRSNGDGTFTNSTLNWGWGFGNPPTANFSVISGDFNGDGKTDVAVLNSTSYQVIGSKGGQPDLMTGITSGLGAQTQISYAALDNYFLYGKGSSAAYPTQDYTGPLWVVASATSSDGIGGTNQKAYFYNGAQMDLHGRGFLGFAETSVLDQTTKLWVDTHYNQPFPWTGTVSETKTFLYNGSSLATSPVLTDQTTGYIACSLPGSRFAVVTRSVSASGNDLDGTALPSSSATYAYDFTDTNGNCVGTTAYGDVTQVSASTSDGFAKTTTNTYGDIVDGSHWLLGRPTQSVVASTANGSTITRTSSLAYNGSTGLVTQSVVEPNNATYRLETDYGYDAFGNKTSVQTVGAGITTRTSTSAYDAQGRFATSVTNALNQTSHLQYDGRFGGVTQATDPNNVSSSSSYDGFGRKILDTAADGTQLATSYTYCSGTAGGTTNCDAWGVPQWRSAYFVSRMPYAADGKTQIGPLSNVHHDLFDRVIASDSQAFDGSGVRTATEYDALGRVAQTSRPYVASTRAPQWTVDSYDVLGRLIKAALPDGTVTTHAYHGLVTVDQNANSQTLTTTKNSQGQVVAVKDTLGNTTRYGYDPVGDLTSVTDPAGNVVGMTYDLRGRLVSKQDPDSGTWSYGYDVLGEPTQVTDAKGQVFTTSYDLLGRVTQRVEPDLTSSWSYDTAANGIGKLAQASTSQGYVMSLTYDALGRPIQSNQTINGSVKTFGIGYDADSRIASISYPSGFTVTRSYTALSYLASEAESDSTASGTLRTVNQMDAEGRVTAESFGNTNETQRAYNPQNGELQSVVAGYANSVESLSYSYDPIGNILTRADQLQGVTDTFSYDGLNRLTSAQLGSNPAVTYGYDAIGNILSKSDVGAFTYGPAGGKGPHQLQSITIGSTSPYAASFAEGTERSYTWTSFNMPASVTEGGKTITFTYDANHARLTQTAPEGTTTYLRDPVTGALEERVDSPNLVVRRHYFTGGVSIWTLAGSNPQTATVRYFHGDGLGSVAVLTDPTGAVVERDGYDAWGKRRYPNGTIDPNGAITSQTNRGYTGQEQLDDVSLVHLNARLYDPLTGRFVSADPIGLNGGANVYAYANNNPVRFTDPSGMGPHGRMSRCINDSPMCGGEGGHADSVELGAVDRLFKAGQDYMMAMLGAGQWSGAGGSFMNQWAGNVGSSDNDIFAGELAGYLFDEQNRIGAGTSLPAGLASFFSMN
ncbi:FG-GAP-like repeat-containing protein, partial [Aliidongia dinghuensis]|uniref:FG-GAP-like repeat-containing protein n=1 Tax=Aliidongia dinghuensis TaxID=1867774 RepID=UPI00166D7C8F